MIFYIYIGSQFLQVSTITILCMYIVCSNVCALKCSTNVGWNNGAVSIS